MTLIWVVLVIAVIGGTVAVALGKGSSMAPVSRDQPALTLPADRPLGAEDLAHVRFGLAARGYRMDEVDALIQRLRDEIAIRDQRLSQLEPHRADDQPRGLATPSPAPSAPSVADPGPAGGPSSVSGSTDQAGAPPPHRPAEQGRGVPEW